MSVENEALMRRWFDQVWNKQQAEMIDALMEDGAIASGMGANGSALHGREAFKAAHALYCGAFPDLHMTIGPMVAEGDLVALHFICEAPHLGDHLGVAPTGKPVTIRGMTIDRWQNGKIAEAWNCIDLLPAFQLIGIVAAVAR